MNERKLSSARLLLAQSAAPLRRWALTRLALLIAQARARYAATVPYVPAGPRVATQRFGTRVWARVTARFPTLGEWLQAAGQAPQPTAVQSWPPHSPEAQPDAAVARDVPALIRALREPSAETAAAAAIALAARAEPAHEPACQAALLEVLENAEGYFHPLTRVAALQSLALRVGKAPSADELAPLLRAVRDVDAEVSLAAIAAVAARAPSDVAIDCLLPVMLDASGYFLPIVREAAARALEHGGLLTKSA